MANDRIRIACKYCGKSCCLFKYYPGSLTLRDADTLNSFVNEHLAECHPYGYGMFLEGEPGFVLVTESDRDIEGTEGCDGRRKDKGS